VFSLAVSAKKKEDGIMSIIEWDGTYSIGIKKLDDHHQHLFTLINRAFDSYNRGAGEETVKKLLDELLEYATYHFSVEEIWMAEVAYPKIEEHYSQHKVLVDKVAEMMELYKTVGSGILASTLIFMNSWLTQHILQSDMDYARYYSQRSPASKDITITA
jgi:hemerythrin